MHVEEVGRKEMICGIKIIKYMIHLSKMSLCEPSLHMMNVQ